MRQQGYAVTIRGFLPVDKTSLASQKAAIDVLTENIYGNILGLCRDTAVEHNFTSREVDEAGNPAPKKPRQPRAKKPGGPPGRRTA